jgi:copper chaperone CopZ
MALANVSNENGGAVVLSISGMTCGGCATSVMRVLSQVPGVASAKVDLAEARAIVAGTAPAAELIAAVRAAGYEAVLSHDLARKTK